MDLSLHLIRFIFQAYYLPFSVAVIVSSNCHSQIRVTKLNLLEKHMQFDRMGGCGNVRNQACDDRLDDCYTRLGREYYFYVAIENSDCIDYVTEKVWVNSFGSGMVPIVWSRTVNYKELLPPNSYINIADYPSIAAFALALDEIVKTPHLYQQYHEWRKSYYIKAGVSGQAAIMCDYLSKRFGQEICKKVSLIYIHMS